MGQNPVGLLTYDTTGHMTIRVMRDPGSDACCRQRDRIHKLKLRFGEEKTGILFETERVCPCGQPMNGASANLKPRPSRRSGARVSEGPGWPDP